MSNLYRVIKITKNFSQPKIRGKKMLLLKEIRIGLLTSRLELSTGYPQTHPNGAPHFFREFIY
jgi:hypothetical protein